MRKFLLPLALSVFVSLYCYSLSPTGLTVDLLGHTDRVWMDGYLSTVKLTELKTAIERFQTVEIQNSHPYLGWIVNSDQPNTLQRGYHILLATSADLLNKDEGDMWDSGLVESDNSVAVKYEGRPLEPSTVYFWKVKTYDNHGYESAFSDVKSFITAAEPDGTTPRYPLQISDEYPVKTEAVNEQTTFADFGKDAFGKLKITLFSKTGRDTVLIHLGEKATAGRINRKPGGTVRYTQYKLPLLQGTHTYTVKVRPDGRNTNRTANESGVAPVFMPDYIGEVYPFRYCEIENYTHPLPVQSVVRQTVHYPFNDQASSFHSSDTILNQVWELCKYSIKATSFMGVYVDGDRERIAYEADAYINQLSHYCVDREFTMARYSHEYLLYNPTWPTEWNLQSVLMAWNDYLYTGNKSSLERYYVDLKAKTLMGLKESNGLISTKTGKLNRELYESLHFRGNGFRDIVDWPQSGIKGDEKEEEGEADGYVLTDYNTVVNAFHYEAVRLLSLIAETLGYQEDARKYKAEAAVVKKQVNALLFDTRKKYYKDGIDTEHSSLHANMFPAAFEMVPEKYNSTVIDFIKSRRMACSVYGSQFLLDAVYNTHQGEYGLQLLTSTGKRSWYNMLNIGSTITLEAWDDMYKPNLDWNHAWGAAPANIIPRKLMGVEPLEPGFRKIKIKPQPGTLHYATAKVPTIRGDVEVGFENVPNEKFVLKVEIPCNTTAEIWLPLWSTKQKVSVDGVSVKGIVKGNFILYTVGSGTHTFHVDR